MTKDEIRKLPTPETGRKMASLEGDDAGMRALAYHNFAASLEQRLAAMKKCHDYLQMRLESIGYHGWAHDNDENLAAIEELSK